MTQIPNFFQPFKKLREALEFTTGPNEINEARVFGQVFATADPHTTVHPEGMKHWREMVHQRLMQMSSTVELRTSCNCTRVIELFNESDLRSWRVPLMTKMNFGVDFSDTPSAHEYMKLREFRWDRRYNDIGMKILEEQ